MPTNTIYRSTVGYLGSHRYYFEVIPRSDSLLSSPSTEYFPLSAIDLDWNMDDNMNDDKFGIKRPDGLSMTLDLALIPDDMKEYLLSPYIRVDMTANFPYKAATHVDVPGFDLTNVFLIKTDGGNGSALVDDFTIYKSYGLKKNPSIKHIITKIGGIQKHKIDVVLHDIVRIICEAMHPIYFTWLAYDDVANNTRATTKTVKRVYDFIYGNSGSADDFYNIKVKTSTVPTTTTVDSVLLSVGDKAIYSNISTNRVEVYQLVDAGTPTYEIILSYWTGTIYEGDRFYVTSGTYAGTLQSVHVSVSDPYSGLGQIVELVEITNESTLSKIFAKIDGNFGNIKAHYLPITLLNTYYKFVFDYFYKKLMRVANSDVNYVMTMHNDLLYAFTCFKQSYDRLYSVGDDIASSLIYFCALVENEGQYSGGFLAENDGEFGIYEYENLLDLLENSKGQSVNVSYYHYDKKIQFVFDTLRGEINQEVTSSVSLDVSDISFSDNDPSFTIEENTDTKRGVIININVPGEDKNEHKYINSGSISDEQVSFKSMFHNNPSVNTNTDGWIETRDYPELNSSYERIVYKQNNPESPFDIHKLVYFDTPATLATSEIAIRLHSVCSVQIARGSTYYYDDTLVKSLPVIDKPWDALKRITIDLQRFSGLPYNTANRMGEYVTKNGRMYIELKIPIESVLTIPLMHEIILNIDSLLLNPDEPTVNERWLLKSRKIKNGDKYAAIQLIGEL